MSSERCRTGPRALARLKAVLAKLMWEKPWGKLGDLPAADAVVNPDRGPDSVVSMVPSPFQMRQKNLLHPPSILELPRFRLPRCTQGVEDFAEDVELHLISGAIPDLD